jgi:hypothetical protein
LLLRHLFFGLVIPGSAVVAPVGLVHHRRLGNELSAIALVDTCFTVGVDLALVVVVDARTCSHAFVVGVVCARESTVEFKLHGIILPFLSKSSRADLEESLAVVMYWMTVNTDAMAAWVFSSASVFDNTREVVRAAQRPHSDDG